MSEFVTVAALHLLAVALPGPDFAVILRQSLHFGRRIGVLTALGIGAGISLHVLYSLIGVAALLQTHPWLMRSAQLLGASWLLYLGVVFIRPSKSAQQTTDNPKPNASHPARAFWLGFMTNASNPKATLFFLALFTSVVGSQTPLSVRLLYGLWMSLATALWFVLVSLIFTQQRLLQRFLQITRRLEAATGLLLMAFSLKLFWQVVNGF